MFVKNWSRGLLALAASALVAQQASAVTVPSAGLVYHLDADTGIVLNGGSVAQWNDTSGNARHFSQGAASKQPLFVASSASFNNKATISFDGDNTGSGGNPLVNPNTDELNLNSLANVQTLIIVNRTTRENTLAGIWGIDNADTGLRRNPAGNWSHPGNANDFSNGGSLRINGVATTAAALNTTHVVTATRGSLLAMPTTSIGDYFQVGANGSRSWQGEIGEIIAYDRVLTAQEMHRIEGALGLKYGFAVRPSVAIGGLIGGDLTDPENDGNDSVPGGANFNAIFTSNNEPGFDPGDGSGEKSFNVFDNKVGGGEAKWCCDFTPGQQITAQITAGPHTLDAFTLTSSNDSPERDPLSFQILGSNDGVNFDTIFAYGNEFGNLFTARNQTLLFEAGVDFALQTTAYNFFRYQVSQTGGANHALGEIEFFGTAPVPEPASMLLGVMALAGLGLRGRRRAA